MSVTLAGHHFWHRTRSHGKHGPAALRWWHEMVLVVALYAAYDTSRGLAHADQSRALSNGATILRWEHAWHLAPEHALNHWLDAVTPLAVAASYIYSTLHYLVTPAVLIWMYRRHRASYAAARTTLAFGTLLALGMYFVVPTAPPRLLPGSGVHDTLAQVASWGWWSNNGSAPRGLGQLTNQVAAMPSLHVGWALWCGVLLVRYAHRSWLRVLGACYPVVIVLVVMSTGNHYLLDAVAGAAVMAVGGALAYAIRIGTTRERTV